jgi:hypothetical protein
MLLLGAQWLDSCCIDKTSSAELSEAINSMYRWYQNAQVCYAYLEDVPAEDSSLWSEDSAFRKSKWFTRGWTLQELLAPEIVVFYDHDWNEIGTRTELGSLIALITGIDTESLYRPLNACIAQKMSWVSERETLREEDMAYCLLGLFDVNMPLLYGEGKKAFVRLQLEIIKQSDDDSIFAWHLNACDRHYHGLLATSPAAFRESSTIRTVYEGNPTLSHAPSSPYTMTNKGLQITLFLVPHTSIPEVYISSGTEDFTALLNCMCLSQKQGIALYLRSEHNGKRWSRMLPYEQAFHPPSESGIERTIVVKQPSPPDSRTRDLRQARSIRLHTSALLHKGFRLSGHRNSHEINLFNSASGRREFLLVPVEEISLEDRDRKLHLRFVSDTDSFDLAIWLSYFFPASMELFHPSGPESLDRLKTYWSAPTPRDRLQCMLQSGEFLLVSFRKMAYNNQPFYIMDFRIEPPSQKLLEKAKELDR